MPNAAKLVSPPFIPSPLRSSALQWRPDLDRRALPPTEGLSPGQRRVLESCLELFAEQGFSASSIRDIASAAGMQSASLYNHFPSKDAMLSELVRIGYEFHLDRLLAAVLNAGADPEDQLYAAIFSHISVHCEYPLLGLVINHELRHIPGESRAYLAGVNGRAAGIVMEILRRGAEQGQFTQRGHHIVLLAFASMGIDSARWFPYQTAIDAEELAGDYARLALRMVAP